MNIKYSLGFAIASIVQAAIIMITEKFNISSLGANITPTQLLIHILAGQVAGYILLYIMRNMETIGKYSLWIIGIIYGTIVWVVLLSINSMIGKVNAPWNQGFSTITASLIAFMTYGILATYAIRQVDTKVVEK